MTIDQRALQRVQTNLGYQFNDATLLSQALTHKSFSRTNNERLEFLGDAVLGYLVGDMLYNQYPAQGEDILSLMRSQLVRRETLAEVARNVGLVDCLRIGSSEKNSGARNRDSLLADAFEAVLGAMHLDGGIDHCERCVQALFHTPMIELRNRELRDPKTQLQEWVQARKLGLPVYQVEEVTGADHAKVFSVRCTVGELELTGTGQGSSRRGAEKAAAKDLLDQVGSDSPQA